MGLFRGINKVNLKPESLRTVTFNNEEILCTIPSSKKEHFKKLFTISIFIPILFAINCSSAQKITTSRNLKTESYILNNTCKEKVINYIKSDKTIGPKYIGSIIKSGSDTITAIFQDTLISGPDDNGWFILLNKNCEIIEIRRGGVNIKNAN